MMGVLYDPMNEEILLPSYSELLKRIERLEKHCFSESIPGRGPDPNAILLLPLSWTASKADMVELINSLQAGGVFNHGKTGIKEIAETFQKLFKIDLGNYYNVFNEIRLRKKNRTALLDHLKEKIIQKMDSLDEKLNS